MLCIGIRVVEQVNGITWRSFPAKHFDQPLTFYIDHSLIVADPANGIVQQTQKITMSGKPIGALDVSREPDRTACSRLVQHNSGFIGMRLYWVSQFRRIAHETWNDCDQWIINRLERNTVLRASNPGCLAEAIKDGVRLASI